MSVSVDIAIYCDVKGCNGIFCTDVPSVRDALEEAAEHGWTSLGRDLCPDHALPDAPPSQPAGDQP